MRIVSRTSTDSGKTWGPITQVLSEQGHTIGNPSPISDAVTKTVWLLYSRDKIVIIRDVEAAGDKPIQVQLYSEHGYKVTGVEMATSGCYVASGDASGVVRIWACDNPEQILKLETPVLGGPILDTFGHDRLSVRERV